MKRIVTFALACLLLISIAGCASSSNSKSDSKTNGSGFSSKNELTVSDKEEIAEEQALKKIAEYMKLFTKDFGKYNINATEYTIGSITHKGDDYTVNGTLYLYNKYGTLEDIATFSSKVRVEDDGYYHATYPTIDFT